MSNIIRMNLLVLFFLILILFFLFNQWLSHRNTEHFHPQFLFGISPKEVKKPIVESKKEPMTSEEGIKIYRHIFIRNLSEKENNISTIHCFFLDKNQKRYFTVDGKMDQLHPELTLFNIEEKPIASLKKIKSGIYELSMESKVGTYYMSDSMEKSIKLFFKESGDTFFIRRFYDKNAEEDMGTKRILFDIYFHALKVGKIEKENQMYRIEIQDFYKKYLNYLGIGYILIYSEWYANL